MNFNHSVVILAIAIGNCLAQSNVSKRDALSALQGKKVTVSTTDGARVQGTALHWQAENLSIQIRKSTDAQRFPVGEAAMPRQSIRTIEVSRGTKKWRVIGTLVGFGVGLPAGAVSGFSAGGGLFSNAHPTRGTTVAFVTLGGITAGGFLVGWALDRRKTVIVVNP